MVKCAFVVGLTLLLVEALPLQAYGQEVDANKAKAEFEQAARYFEAEEYEAALPHFERAYEISGRRASTIFGLAQCERALKMYGRAITHYYEYLASDPEDAQVIRETITLLEDLKRKQDAKLAEEKRKREEEEQRAAEEEARRERERDRAAREALAQELAMARKSQAANAAFAPSAQTQVKQDEGGLLESPVFWIVAGVVVAGGVAGGVLASGGGSGATNGGSTGVILGGLRGQ